MPRPKIADADAPAESGYAMPAEWDPHEATWLGWPHNETDWPDKLDTIRWVYGEIVRKISPGEFVRILVRHQAEKLAASYLNAPARFETGRVYRASHESRLDARQRTDFRPTKGRAGSPLPADGTARTE